METILKLDDLIETEKTFSINNKTYTLDTSINAFIKFLKWNELVVNPDDNNMVEKNLDLLDIIVREREFREEFAKLSFKSQNKILTKVLELWNEEINTVVQESSEKTKK